MIDEKTYHIEFPMKNGDMAMMDKGFDDVLSARKHITQNLWLLEHGSVNITKVEKTIILMLNQEDLK
jgi:hypothetical protein